MLLIAVEEEDIELIKLLLASPYVDANTRVICIYF